MKWTTIVLAAALAVGACRSRGPATQAGDSVATGAAASGDSTVFGDDRAREGNPPRAPEVALLEALIDEYETLDVVQDELARPSADNPVKGHAWKGDRHEDAAKARLGDLLTAEYGERYQPRTPSTSAATADSLAALSSDSGRRALDRFVLAQHRRVSAAITDALPSLTNPSVRAELTRLNEALRKEVERLGGR